MIPLVSDSSLSKIQISEKWQHGAFVYIIIADIPVGRWKIPVKLTATSQLIRMRLSTFFNPVITTVTQEYSMWKASA